MDKDVRSTDPYALMFDTIVNYYERNNPKFLELFKTCLYIKSNCTLTNNRIDEKEDFKRGVMIDYVQSWQWKREKIQNFDSIKEWEFQQVSTLGQQIHSFLIGCYRRLSAKLQGQEQLVSQQDMTVIGRKIVSFYGSKDGKVQYLKRAFETGLIQQDITITMELDLSFDTKQRWSAFRGRLNYHDTITDNPYFLKSSCDPVELVLWCIFNRIIDNNSKFYLWQNDLALHDSDITELINEALAGYEPIRVSELSRDILLSGCQIIQCLVVVNFSSHSSVQDVETVRVIYLTSWGELFSFSNLDAFTTIKQQFSTQQIQPLCRLFTPTRNKRKVLYKSVEALTDYEFSKVGY